MNLTVNNYASTQVLISSVENINISGNYTSSGLDAQNVVSAKKVSLSTNVAGGTGTLVNASAQKVTEVVAGSNIDTLNVNAAAFTGGTGGTITVGVGSASTVNIGNVGNSGTDTYTVAPNKLSTLDLRGGSDGTDTFTVTLPGGGITLNINNNTDGTGEIDNLNLVSSGSAANTVTLTTTTAAGETLVDSGTGDKLLVSGSQNLTIVGDLDSLADIGGTGTRLTNAAIEKASGYSGTVTWTSNAALTGAAFINRSTGLDVLNVTTTALGANLTVHENTTVNLAINNGSLLYDVDNATTTSAAAGSGTLKIGLTGDTAANATQTGISAGQNVGVLVITNNTSNSTITALNTATSIAADTVVVSGSKNLTITTWTADTNEVLTATGMTGSLTATSATAAATMIGGSGADVLTGGATLADLIVGGGGSDVLSGGGGAGADTLTGGSGSDRFVIGGTITTADRITDFTTSDVIAISVGATGISALNNGNSATIGAGTTVGVASVSTTTTLAAADNVIILTGTFATQAVMETAIEAGGSRQLTLGSANTAGDDYILVWSDGTNAYIGVLQDTAGAATTFSSGTNTSFTNAVTLAGVTSVDDITAANFLFVA